MRLHADSIKDWKMATKTRTVLAKPFSSLVADPAVDHALYIKTLEGIEGARREAVVCLGIHNEPWFQTVKKLLQKYEVTDITSTGWLVCTPRPDNAVNCVQIDMSLFLIANNFSDDDLMTNDVSTGQVYVIGQWGEKADDGCRQYADIGDYVCQNQTDPTDIWIVKKSIFEATYEVK